MSTTRRRAYAQIYLPVDPNTKRPAMAKDRRARAFTSYETARDYAAKKGMIVTNWSHFVNRILPELADRFRPTGMHICSVNAYGGKIRYYHAELDAPDEQLRTLNQHYASDANHGIRQPTTPKVWEVAS